MKKGHWIFILLLGLSLTMVSQEVKVMTYNIKYDNTSDTVNNWNDRKATMVRLLKHYKPSFIGGQEVLHHQLQFLDSSLTSYAYIGVGREDGVQAGEYSPILFDTLRYKVLENNTFWLSDTPDRVSVGWDAALERICTYGLFEDLTTGRKFWIFNTHFDHIGQEARRESVQLILRKIEEINTDDLPVILMGDLNLGPEEPPIRLLQQRMVDGKGVARKPFYGPEGTSNGFDPMRPIQRRIDYIFVQGFEVAEYVHIDDRLQNNKHVSDHLPVLATVAPKD